MPKNNPEIPLKQLTEASELLKHISNNSPGALYQFKMDTEGQFSFTYVSDGFESMTGVSKDIVLENYMSLFQHFHPDDLPGLMESIKTVRENLQQWNYKFRLIKPDTGETIWIKGTSNYEVANDGSILWNGIIVDITDIEELQEKLIESNARYEYATKATNDVIWDWDLISDRLHWSDGFEMVFGSKLTEDKFNIHFWEDCIHEDDREKVSTSIQKSILNSEETRWEENYRLVRPDGSIAYINDRGYIIHNKHGRPVRMVGAMKDITDVQLVAMERQKLTEDLIRRNEALEQFTYIVSHNVRAPVANLMGLAQAILEGGLDEEAKKIMTEHLLDSANKLDSVLKDLNYILSVSDKNAGLRKESVEFEKVLNKIKDEMKNLIESEHVKITADFSKAPKIKVVENYMYIILYNLISNGIRFKRGENSFIKIFTWKDEKYIYLEYEDNGIGVDLEKFGYKFYDLYHTFHPHIKGKGVGAFLIKTIMDNINGEIAVTSKVGEGTKFFLKFNNLL
jgi:PAS domain S-box-containing protein